MPGGNRNRIWNMLVWLYDSTPQHRDNFLKLAEQGYFDSLLFHRVIKGFMIQGGDPNSRNAPKNQPLGSGGPGYTIPAEFVDSLVHFKGAPPPHAPADQVNPEKRSSGSQFYIVQGQPVTAEQLDQLGSAKRLPLQQRTAGYVPPNRRDALPGSRLHRSRHGHQRP